MPFNDVDEGLELSVVALADVAEDIDVLTMKVDASLWSAGVQATTMSPSTWRNPGWLTGFDTSTAGILLF